MEVKVGGGADVPMCTA